MDVDKLQSERAKRPPPPRLNPHPRPRPPSRIPDVTVDVQSDLNLTKIDLNYALAMDDRVRETVQFLREKKSVLILDPERLEAQEEEAAAELYVVLQNVSSCKVIEADAERRWQETQKNAYNREMENAQLRRDQWKAYDDWVKHKGPLWDPVKAWEKMSDTFDKKKSLLNVKTIGETRRREVEEWLKNNPVPPRPPNPPAPPLPEGPSPDAEVKVTDVKNVAAVSVEVNAAYSVYLQASKDRRNAEDYCVALQQKLSLISGMQGARNRGI